MSYAAEAKAIEDYFKSKWLNRTPVAMERKGFGQATQRVELTINNGAVLQGSIGRTADRIDYVGVLQVAIYTGPDSNDKRREFTEEVETIFRDKRITDAGGEVASGDTEFIRFSPQNQHPYIASIQRGDDLHRTLMNVPFNRYEYRS